MSRFLASSEDLRREATRIETNVVENVRRQKSELNSTVNTMVTIHYTGPEGQAFQRDFQIKKECLDDIEKVFLNYAQYLRTCAKKVDENQQNVIDKFV